MSPVRWLAHQLLGILVSTQQRTTSRVFINRMDESYKSYHGTQRQPNPWGKFTQRKEAKHRGEDTPRLCNSSQPSTSQVVETFLTHDRTPLDEQIPGRRQVLRDFLHEAVTQPHATTNSFFIDVERCSGIADIALIDDRQKHERCTKAAFGEPCNGCRIYSKKLSLPDLCQRLQGEVGE